jgi:hypothetical protein
MIYNNIYEYDIESCYPNIYSLYFNYTELQYMEKEERNIKIGLFLKDKKIMQNHIKHIIDNFIYMFMIDNNIYKKDILIRQKDGILCTKSILKKRDDILYPRLKNKYNYFISDETFKKYIGFNFKDKKCIIKGVPYKSVKLESFLYNNLKEIDLENISLTLSILRKTKKIFYNSNNKLLFAIDNDKDNYLFFIKDNQQIKVNKNQYQYIDINIDKDKYFDNYFFFWDIILDNYINYINYI